MLRNRNDIFIHFTTHKNVELTIPFVRYYHLFQKQLCVANRDHTFLSTKYLKKYRF